MKVNIDFAQYIAVIEFEPFLGEDINKYKKEFKKLPKKIRKQSF